MPDFLMAKTPLGQDELRIVSIVGHEELSSPFRYVLEFQSTNHNVDPFELVGENTTVRIDLGDRESRFFNGYISDFSHVGWGQEYSTYRAVVVPWLWFLDQTADCRIFQDMSTPEIAQQVFKDYGLDDVQLKLTGSYPKHDYCVQYRETAFNFVSRLLEEEGIFYFFKHRNGGHQLVLADSASAYFTMPDSTAVFPDPSHIHAFENQIKDWEHSYHFRPGAYAHRDYNFETPRDKLQREQKSRMKIAKAKSFEVYDYPGRHPEGSRGDFLAKVRLQESEARHDVAMGASTYETFTAGGRFQFEDHRSSKEIGKSYVLTRVHLEARLDNFTADPSNSSFVFQNRFECIPADANFRPPRRARKPIVEGPQTAMIVGPSGEEIYVDQFARVKVQFHWDRRGNNDEKSSCWIRVSQAWAGAGFGCMNIPRIGQEVIVEFLEGDPDRPIITGRVYNAESMPNASNAGRDTPEPGEIPAAAMMTSFKSNSLGGSGGYNEITMNDEGGKEGLFFKAQKDEIHKVGNNRTDTVGNDEILSVINNRTRSVGVDEKVDVGNNQDSTIGVNKSTKVGTSDDENIGVVQKIYVGTSQSTTVGSSQSNSVGKEKKETVGMMSNEMVGVMKTTNVGAVYSIISGAAMNTAVGFVSAEEVGIKKFTMVGSTYSIKVGSGMAITAGEKFEIVCGASKLVLEAGGKVTIEGTEFLFSAKGNVKINGSIIDLN